MIRLPSSTGGSTTSTSSSGDGPLPWLPGIPDRIATDPNWGPYLHARSHLVAQLADQVRTNAEGEAPAWAAVRHALSAGRADRRRPGVARRHPGRPQRPATHRATPTRLRRPNLGNSNSTSGLAAADTQHRLAMAATARHRSPQCDRRPIPAGADRKVDATSPGPASTPPSSCGRRPPQDPYPTTTPPQPSGGASSISYPANAEPGLCNPRRRPSDQAHDHDVTRPAAHRWPRSAPPPAFGPSR